MKLVSTLFVVFGFHFSFAAEIPQNTEAELNAASPELMKLLDQVSRGENIKSIEAMDENGEPTKFRIQKGSAKSDSENQDLELSNEITN
ncbi:MAG: hypothetical protein A4S09_16660 [Proteobacteria bacterium SG_bin7]|nr:MAG: hypothetical protein A4S09_16660 [Proteobacteria bacterium SG_bin7]